MISLRGDVILYVYVKLYVDDNCIFFILRFVTTRKLKNRDENLETKIFPSLFRHGKISVSKFPSLKVARYVPFKF